MDEMLRLMVPGPTQLPPEVREALSQPMTYHRDRPFMQAMLEVVDSLRRLLYVGGDEDYKILLLAGTGRAAMEAALVNCFCVGDEVLGVSNGHFGELFSKMGDALGLKMHSLAFPWDKPLDLAEMERCLTQNSSIKGILFTYIETSGAIQNDIQAVGKLARKYDKLLLVDAVSALGCAPIKMKEYGVDVVISASQKGLMCPAGMSVVALSPKAFEAVLRSDMPRYYFDMRKMQEFIVKGQTPVSTPVPLLLALHASLRLMEKEGFENVFERHERAGAQIRAAAMEAGYALYPGTPDLLPAASLSAFLPPKGLPADVFVTHVKEKYNTLFARGLGAISNMIFRIGHMGYFYDRDVEHAVMVLRSAKTDLM